MKRSLVAIACCLLLGIAARVSGNLESSCRLTLRLIDAETGATLPGVIRLVDRDGNPVKLRVSDDAKQPGEPLSRGLGVDDQPAIERWSVVTGEIQLQAPREKLTVEAFSGLETELSRSTLELAGRDSAKIDVPLKRFYNAQSRGMRSANTHLHLKNIGRELADRYLTEVPTADRLDVLFVSYLERAEADRDYISNKYTRDDFERLTKATGTVFGNGEEHRHNMTAQTQGYGHVLLLEIPRLIQPVSIGPGISKTGTDGLPLQRGIDQAHRDDATVIWCHNDWGFERIPDMVLGRIDAINFLDGGPHGSFKDSFYRGLNAGLKVPFSTGTDWFIYDFSRTYAKVEGPLTARSWLKSLTEGRTFITNGPFLEFQVAGKEPGESVQLDGPSPVSIVGRGVGRVDFQRIELIQNGRVIRSQPCRQESGHFVADLRFDLSVDAPCWLALRIPPPPVKEDPELQDSVPLNEYGQPLFAHTSAIHVKVGGHTHFDRDVANQLVVEMRNNIRTIVSTAQFADEAERARVVDVYQEAIAEMERRITEVGRN